MKKLFLFRFISRSVRGFRFASLFIFCLLPFYLFSQNYQWAKSIGSTSDDIGFSIVTDGSGNVYVIGCFGGAADFDPGPGTVNLTAVGYWDIFFAKYDNQGNYLWANKIGGIGWDKGYNIATDVPGNVLITGYFGGTTDFDPGTGTAYLTAVCDKDIFFAKYDNQGNYLWAKSIGSTGVDHGHSITSDDSGNVYITGWFGGTADFDPGAGTINMTNVYGDDIFFAKYDNNGNYLWAKSIGGTSSDNGYSIATDGSGNVYIAGYFEDNVDFDPGADTANLTVVGDWYSSDIFFAKYDNQGNYLWAKNIGSTDRDGSNSIITDGSGNVYITGRFQDTADFDPGAGTANLTSVGDFDFFFAKYDNNGNFLWAKSIGSTGDEEGCSIATDGLGNVYITGQFWGTADFDPGAGTVNLTASDDIFFAKYDNQGNYLWAKSIGSTGSDRGSSIATDALGNVYLTGFFGGTADFDPGIGTANLTSVGGIDIFFAKYSQISGTEENTFINNQFTIYPNPATTQITIYISSAILTGREGIFVLYDLLGRERIAQVTFNREQGTYVMDVSELPCGVYLVKFQDENGVIVKKKFIKI